MAENNKEDDKKNNNEKSPNKKSSTINYNLIGLVIISIAAFFGFGAIFSQMQLNIGAQASSAAFAALFILLSTKFLMDKESENKLKAEKEIKVFDDNLKDYKMASQKMLDIMENNTITEKELHVLMHSHADLIILGHVSAIEASSNFIKICQNILLESFGKSEVIDSRNHAYNISIEKSKELWEQIVYFQLASRDGLNLKDDSLVANKLKKTFIEFNEKQNDIDMQISNILGVNDWLLYKNNVGHPKDSDEYRDVKSHTEQLIEIIVNAGLKKTIKKSQISFANPEHKKEARVIYLNNYSTQKKRFSLSFAGTENYEFFKELETKLKKFDPNLRNARGKFDIVFYVTSENLTDPIIPKMLKAYMDEFHK